MKKNVIFLGSCLISIVMGGILEVNSQKPNNPYSWFSPLKWMGHRKDMKQYGYEDINKKKQKEMAEILKKMQIENYKISLKKLEQNKYLQGVATDTGIWIDPNLSDSETKKVQYRLAREYWKKNEQRYFLSKADLDKMVLGLGVSQIIHCLSWYKLVYKNYLPGEKADEKGKNWH